MDDEQKTLEKLPRRFEHFPFGRSTSHPPCSLPHLIAPSSSAASVDTNADVPIGSDSFHQTRLTTDTTNPNNTALSEERNQEQDNLTERKPTQRTFRMVNIPNEYTLKDIRRLFPDARAITGCSLAQSPYSDSTKVATISFNEIPPALRMKSNETQRRIQFSPNGLCSFEAIVDDHFWGLTPLNDLTGDTRMDLIAVTGLAGHAYGSWKERGGNTMWLRDLVPEDIPTIRVLTYGFNSVLVGSKSTSSIRQFAKTFLEDVLNTRETSDGKQRPLIFIGHSLGGLIVKEAIAAAAKAAKDPKRTYGALLTSVYGAIFFGVPNRGLKIDELVHMVKGQPNERLVRDLAPRSEFLEMLHETFCERFDFNDTEVISFYETEETKTVKRNEIGQWTRDGPSVILVEKVSAVDTVPNEAKHNQIPIDRDHSNIVKFTGRSDTYYVTLRRHLKRFAADGPAVIKRRLDLGILPGMPTVMTSTSTENIPPPVPEESSKAAASNIALDMNREDNVGLTTLMRTVLRQDEQEVKLLLENKTDPTVADLGGRTPLHYALQIGNMKIAKLLLDNGADINASNYAGLWTPLHHALMYGSEEMVRLLLEYKPDISKKHLLGGSALHMSVIHASENLMKRMLENKPDLEDRTCDGKTTLHLTVETQNLVKTRIMLEHGADINAQILSNGCTAMHMVAISGNLELSRTLLEYGANVDQENVSGVTPRQQAKLYGKTAVLRLIEESEKVGAQRLKWWHPRYQRGEGKR